MKQQQLSLKRTSSDRRLFESLRSGLGLASGEASPISWATPYAAAGKGGAGKPPPF